MFKKISMILIATQFICLAAHAGCEEELHAKKSFLNGNLVIELSTVTKPNGKVIARVLRNTGFKSRVINYLVEKLHPTLKLQAFAEATDRMGKRKDLSPHFFTHFAEEMNTRVHFDAEMINRIPKTGPVIMYANHPLSAMEVIAMGEMVEQVRTDVKSITTEAMSSIPGMKENGIFVNTLKSEAAKKKNREYIAQMNAQLTNGGVLLLCPAGRVSRLTPESPHFAVDREWQKGIVQMVEHNPQAKLVPVFFEGQPSPLYLKTQKMFPDYADILLISELSKTGNTDVYPHVGNPISLSDMDGLTEQEKISYLRARVYVMGSDYYPSFPLLNEEEVRLLAR